MKNQRSQTTRKKRRVRNRASEGSPAQRSKNSRSRSQKNSKTKRAPSAQAHLASAGETPEKPLRSNRGGNKRITNGDGNHGRNVATAKTIPDLKPKVRQKRRRTVTAASSRVRAPRTDPIATPTATVPSSATSGTENSAPDLVTHGTRKRRQKVRCFGLWTLDAYMIRSFLVSYLVCAASFVSLYVAVEAFTKLNRFVPAGRNSVLDIISEFAANIARYHAAMVPTIFVNYMGPILTLSAAMFSLTFLNRGNEFTSVKASGVSLYRMLLPIFLIATCFSGLTFSLQEWVIPEMREPIRHALALSRSDALKPDPFYDPLNNLHIRVERYNPAQKVAAVVTVWNWNLTADPESHDRNTILDAKSMVWVPNPDSTPRNEKGRWLLREGSIQRYNADWRGELIYNQEVEKFYQLKEPFAEKLLETTLLPIDLETSDQDISYLSSEELRSQHKRQPYHHHLLARLHHHYAFPFSHVILLLLGIPFVLNYRSRSFFLSLAAGFVLCAAYFLVSSMALSLASDPGEHSLPPVLASWLPNVLFGSLGLTIFVNMRT